MENQVDDGVSYNCSIFSPYGYQSGSCGYCKDESSSVAFYAKTSHLSPWHYQELADRGWRRSGTLLYKPDQKRSCCPHYTIRLPAQEFRPSKNQRQAVNRWNKFILGDEYLSQAAKKRPVLSKQERLKKDEFDLSRTVHESEYENLHPDLHPNHKFQVTLEHDDFTNEKYALFEQYQRLIHKEKAWQISKQGFRRFLCSSPLVRRARTVDGKTQRLGSYHQCYRLDGRLIALGVLDLLPHSVSSVYFIYECDFENSSFGRISAMREIALANEGSYGYYYMGYYIHSCTKMRYKIDFKPQYVLDTETNEYSLLDEDFRSKLDNQKYVSLSRERETDQEASSMSSSQHNAVDEFSSPLQAVGAGLSLFSLQLSGITPLDKLLETLDFDQMPLLINFRGQKKIIAMEGLVHWEEGSFNDPKTIKGTVADLASAVGPTIANEMIVDFAN